ncbi:MAG: peroxiredoxin [Lentimonas sp.]
MIFSLFANLLSAEIELGTAAPKISVIDQKGELVDLGAALGEGTALIFFYPKALTGGCTKQVCSIRDNWDVLKDRGVKAFGASSDTKELQKEFSERYELPFQLIADTEQVVSKAFGKNRFSRQAYLFQDGVLVWRDLKASTAKQAEDVLAALDKLEAK